ncbi:hypothetical protein Tco_0335189 [Tanacetum coccineum]
MSDVGQMLLVDHHTDDAERVDVTEPGVHTSITMRGSNILNPLPEPTDRPKISTSANKFDDLKSVECHLTSILVFTFSETWTTWGCFALDHERRFLLTCLATWRKHIEKYQEGKVESHAENVESHPRNEKQWNKVGVLEDEGVGASQRERESFLKKL